MRSHVIAMSEPTPKENCDAGHQGPGAAHSRRPVRSRSLRMLGVPYAVTFAARAWRVSIKSSFPSGDHVAASLSAASVQPGKGSRMRRAKRWGTRRRSDCGEHDTRSSPAEAACRGMESRNRGRTMSRGCTSPAYAGSRTSQSYRCSPYPCRRTLHSSELSSDDSQAASTEGSVGSACDTGEEIIVGGVAKGVAVPPLQTIRRPPNRHADPEAGG